MGAYAPERRLTNADLETMCDTTDEWITTRTGIKERRIAADDETLTSMALAAGRQALAAANLQAGDLDLILVATSSCDVPFPPTACRVQAALEVPGIPAIDLLGACSGFAYGLSMAESGIRTGMYRHVLVIGVEILSRLLDYSDRNRNTCVLFGDGAGAAVVGPAENGSGAILGMHLGADGRGAGHVELIREGYQITFNGREIFRFAVSTIPGAIKTAAAQAGVSVEDLDWVVLHQANQRIITAIAEQLQLPPERLIVNVDRYGNTAAASVPMALEEGVRDGRIRPGQLVALAAFGVGVTWGIAIVRW